MSAQPPTAPVPPVPPAPQIQPQLSTWETEANALNLQGERRTLFRLLRGFHDLVRNNARR